MLHVVVQVVDVVGVGWGVVLVTAAGGGGWSLLGLTFLAL
jgi:hypothetical protein